MLNSGEQTIPNYEEAPQYHSKNNDVITIDIVELLLTFLSKWKLIAIVAVIGAIFGGIFNYFFIDTTYRADAQIYITNTNTTINFQDIQLSSALTVDYQEIITSRTVLKKVIKDLELDINYEELSNLITVQNPDDSHIIRIYVETSDPDLSLKIANSLVKVGIDKIYRVVGNDVPTIIDSAEVDAVKAIKASITKYIAIGFLFGFFVVCGFIALGVILDNSIKSEDDITDSIGLPVLASIPEFSDDIKTDEDPELKKKKRRSK